MSKKVMLIIRDGWGEAEAGEFNYVSQATTPFQDMLIKVYPSTLLHASGTAVGLPEGTMGNSEVGHTTIGLGRIIHQPFMIIEESIRDGSFAKNSEIKKALDFAKRHGTGVHIIGLLQTKSVHSHLDHILALVQAAITAKSEHIFLHLITDGRDSPIHESVELMKQVLTVIKPFKQVVIASICGRFFAMDRDNRWERIQQAYEAMVTAKSQYRFDDEIEYLHFQHEEEEGGDEFINPGVHNNYLGMDEHDVVFFANFRTDRTRQLTRTMIDPLFIEFPRFNPAQLYFVMMTEYSKDLTALGAKTIIRETRVENSLGEVVSKAGKTQLRISETEKYPHVTFFLNGQVETVFKGEERDIIPSPKVLTYDLQPEMSANEVAQKLVELVKVEQFDLVVCNLVNADMVGHTGKKEAIIRACEAVDQALEMIVNETKELGYSYLITADHGNAEKKDGENATTHSLNQVKLIVVDDEKPIVTTGGLVDIAPTILHILDIPQPDEMTGKSLI
jgi:2,3-bisphosphoglycerate-independent phosphoglycerate mutase